MRTDETEAEMTQQPWEKYRLAAQKPARQAEGHALDVGPYAPPLQLAADEGTRGTEGKGHQDGARIRRFKRRIPLGTTEIAVVIFSLVGIFLVGYPIATQSGYVATGVLGLVALLPLGIVVAVLARVDRFAPLKLKNYLFAFVWGAGAAAALGGTVNTALFADLIAIFGDVAAAEFWVGVVVAPVGEELFKGLGVALILVLARRQIVTVTNGIAIGGLVGAGFAFTENISYFALAQSEGSFLLGFTILARGVLSPFIHPMATSFTGLFFVLAFLSNQKVWGWTWRLGIGLLLAIAVHALWNGLASAGAIWIVLYFVIELPLFIIWLVAILRAGNQQPLQIRRGLQPYLATGWISEEEVRMVSDKQARKYARKWGSRVGKEAKKAINSYLLDAGRLGLTQNHLEKHGDKHDRTVTARHLLAQMLAARQQYLTLGALHAELHRSN